MRRKDQRDTVGADDGNINDISQHREERSSPAKARVAICESRPLSFWCFRGLFPFGCDFNSGADQHGFCEVVSFLTRRARSLRLHRPFPRPPGDGIVGLDLNLTPGPAPLRTMFRELIR